MPIFDLTTGIRAQHRTGATLQDAYDTMKRIVVTFAKRGYAIDWQEQKPPERIVANLTDKDGTDLRAEIAIADEGTTTRCDISIKGKVFLGGLLGRIVTANTIQSRAQEKIKELLDEEFRGQPSKRAPIAKPAAPAAPPPVAAKPPPVAAKPVEPPAPPPAAAAGDPLRKAAAAAGARGVGDLGALLTLQRSLLVDIARARGGLDDAGADALLVRIGATREKQQELVTGVDATAWLKSSAAAYALTWAVGEVGTRALGDPGLGSEVLQTLFESTYERVLGEKLAAHGVGSVVGDKLEQVREAYEAALLSEAEMLRLRERVLFAL
jgi:hypothetical protein